MSPLISCQEIAKSYGSRELFNGLSIALFPTDRVGLIGPNGAGKSTFLKLLAGIDSPDSGAIVCKKGLRIGYVPQQLTLFSGTAEEAVQETAEAQEPHECYMRSRKVLGILGFDDPSQKATSLSGGWQRRLSLARALVNDPDLLLLDEPTNHLDLETLLWLESFLQRLSTPFVVTSHDRVFLDRVSNKIWEISHSYPGGLFSVNGAYREFMEKRAAFLTEQTQKERGLCAKLRREEAWLQRSPQARSTKARSRIQEAAKLQQEVARIKRRNYQASPHLAFAHTGRQTKKLLSAKNLSKTLGGKELFTGIELSLYRGDRLAIVGENGSGKSTLLKILAQELPSDSGTVKWADELRLFYFDQHREQLDLEQPLRRGLAPDGDTVFYQGKRQHVNSWCENFLFTKNQLDLPMKQLSGGERARVLIARLMLKPADLLLLDEPTNDLDIDTLEILEESLDHFSGAVVLVTHDRALTDRIADELLALDGGRFNDVDAWLEWRRSKKRRPLERKNSEEERPKPQGLSFSEQHELKKIEEQIAKLEEIIHTLAKKASQENRAEIYAELMKKQTELDCALERWQTLEEKRIC